MTFSAPELVRYQRQLSLAGFGPEAQAALWRGRVLVIGAGGLGCPLLLYLTAAGVGRITLVDPDRVELSNLHRQVLYTEDQLGEPKALAAARRLRELNPHSDCVPLVDRFRRDNALELAAAHDVIVDGSDNFATRYLANDAAVLAGRPLVYAAIHGFEGQVSVFNWRGGPTYRCLFPEPPPPGTVPNCAEAGVVGVLPGLIGSIQAAETIKLLTGLGEPLSGRLLLWNVLTMQTQIVRFAADPERPPIRELPPDEAGATCAVPGALETEGEEILAAWSQGRPCQLLDVREGWERGLGAILPSAHVPLGELERTAELALDPAVRTIVYCAVGVRSLRGAEVLRTRFGFRDVASLRGGYRAWQEASAS